jgi:hypothetical protein
MRRVWPRTTHPTGKARVVTSVFVAVGYNPHQGGVLLGVYSTPALVDALDASALGYEEIVAHETIVDAPARERSWSEVLDD